MVTSIQTKSEVPSKLAKIMVYLEQDLKEIAENMARRERRSVSSLFVRLLEEAIEAEKSQSKKEDK